MRSLSRLARRSVAGLAVLLVVGTSFPGVTGAVPNPETDGVSNLASCYAQNRLMAVELVIDESQSLRSTDPDGRRVELARAITEAMAQISTIPLGGQPGRIDFQVVGFGTQTSAVVPWQTLDRTSADAVVAQVESFRDRDDQLDTDYVDALSSARGDVLKRAAVMRPENPDGVCRAVFWFSDGKFDFEPHGIQPGWAPGLSLTSEARVREAVDRGTRLLCEPSGIADQYRSSETYLLTAALLSPGFNQNDEALLRNVTEGGGGCGALPGRPTGAYFSAEDVGRLVRLIVPTVIGPPPPPQIDGENKDGALVASFLVDGATVGVNLFVEALPGGQIELFGPAGASLDITPASVDGNVDGVPVSSRAAGSTRLATLDLTGAGAPADGTWTVRFTPEGAGKLAIWAARRTGISLSPVEPQPWTRGEPGGASFQLIDSAGTPLAATDLASVALQGRVTHGEETVEVPALLTPGTSEVTLTATPSRSEPASAASIDVNGTVTTAAGDQIPVTASTRVPVNVAGAPVPPESLNLGVITPTRQKQRDAQGRQPVLPVEMEKTITVTAPADGDGIFCVPDDSSITVNGQEVRLSAVGDDCVQVPAGASADFVVGVAIERPVNGTVAGSLAATTRSELQQEASPVAIAVRGEIVVPPGDPVVDGGTFWALVLGSLVVAGGLWIGLSWWTSRFKDPTLIAGFRVPVTIRPATSDFSMPPMDPDKWEYLRTDGPRSVVFEDLEITAPVRIFRSQDAIVERPKHIAHGNQGAAGHGSSLKGRIAHQIQGQWVFTVPLGAGTSGRESEISGELFFFVLGDAVAIEAHGGGLMERAKQELSARLPDIIERVQRHAPPGVDEPPLDAVSSGGAEPGSSTGLM